MKYKKSIIIIILAIFLITIASASAGDVNDSAIADGDNAPIELSQSDETNNVAKDCQLLGETNNEEIISEPDKGTFKDLENKIRNASGNTIKLENNYECEGGYDLGIKIDKSITIDGQGHTIDAKQKSRIFDVIVNNVVFKNITFANGKTDSSAGGAIRFSNNNENCDVHDCVFVNNSAKHGGAINWGSYNNIVVKDCVFVNNSASQGGAIYTYQWGKVSAINCIAKTSTDNTFNVVFETPTLTVNDFISPYGSGDRLTFNLTTKDGMPISDANITIEAYDNNTLIGKYSCLSGEGWIVNLPIGSYDAVYKTEYMGLGEITKTIKTTDRTTFWDLNRTINGNDSDVIDLDKNYTFNPDTDGEFKNGIFIYKAITINGNGSTIDAKHSSRIFVLNSKDITLANITFVNGNSSDESGGAIYGSGDNCNVCDCTFKNCNANSGGAIAWMGNGVSISRSTFVNNSGSEGGAIYWLVLNGNVTGCIFLNNSASQGSAFYNCNMWNLNTQFNNNILLNNAYNAIYSIDVSDSDFDFNWFGNNATDYMSQPSSLAGISDAWLFLNATSDSNTIEVLSSSNIVFKLYPYNASLPTYDNALLMPIELTITSANGKLNTSHVRLGEKVKYSATTVGKGRITATIENIVCTIELDILKADSTLTVNDNITFDYGCAGSTTLSFTNASAVVAEVIGQPNAVVSVKNNTITVSGLNAGNYTLSITTVTDNNHNNVTKNATITVNRAKTELSADDITATYNINRDLIITLKDVNGNPVAGASVSVDLNGVKKYVTDANGQVKVSTKGLAPKTYTAKITFNGDSNYNKTSKDVKVTVIKATPKIIAKKKTYRAKATKKFTITLKDNNGKPIKNAKVRLIVKKIAKKTKKTTKKTTKKYKKNIKKTNKKGKATFKVKRNKKGKYTAIIKYYGNKYFKAITKKVKITIK